MPRCATFTFKENGLRALRVRSGSAAMISSGRIRRTSGRSRTARCKGDVEVHDVELVLDERAAGLAVLAAPFDVGEVDAVAFDQEAGAAIGKRIDDRRRAGGRVVVELGARPVDVAGMKEARQPIVGAVERAADQRGDVGRAQEAMARELPHDLHVVVGEAEGRRFRRTAEPRQSGGRGNDGGLHTEIIPPAGSASRERAEGGESANRSGGRGKSAGITADPLGRSAPARPSRDATRAATVACIT